MNCRKGNGTFWLLWFEVQGLNVEGNLKINFKKWRKNIVSLAKYADL